MAINRKYMPSILLYFANFVIENDKIKYLNFKEGHLYRQIKGIINKNMKYYPNKKWHILSLLLIVLAGEISVDYGLMVDVG
jgi:hypothetical protein